MRKRPYRDDLDDYRFREARHQEARSQSELNLWQKLSKVLEVVIYVLIALSATRLISPELDRQRALKRELAELTAIRDQKAKAVTDLKREHSNLISDKNYLEVVARDRLNLQLEGEYIIQIER